MSFKMMTTIVWDKRQIGASTAWGSYQSPSQPSFPTQFEFVIVVGKDTLKHEGDKSKISVTGKEFQRNSRALWSFPPETRMMELYGHPACFPEELPRRLIHQLSYEDDVVLDPFSGAGTTCVVAKKLRRHFIGIEMSPKYHKRSLKRLDETVVSHKKTIKDKKTGKEKEVVSFDWME
jgi:site-specific DNA-methyltransferase (adenine-specific)